MTERISGGITITEPKYNKISINNELCGDKVELVISPDFELKQEGDKWFAVKKKKEYPKTYEECCMVLGIDVRDLDILDNMLDTTEIVYRKNLDRLLNSFRKLLICRDAYWKIAGEEMGSGKPWEPTMETVYCISRNDNVIKCSYRGGKSNIFEFPTAEIRDAFYENFKSEIENCKEFL